MNYIPLCNAKEKNKLQDVESAGDAWTFVGIGADIKLIISWLLEGRDVDTTTFFMRDLAERVKERYNCPRMALQFIWPLLVLPFLQTTK